MSVCRGEPFGEIGNEFMALMLRNAEGRLRTETARPKQLESGPYCCMVKCLGAKNRAASQN